MNKNIILKLKKYLFYISILFSISILIHLIYIYLYNDFEEEPIKGGTISEAIIGDFPYLNPLLPSNDHNKYINHILYRSLLTYDVNEKNIVSDLVSCDLSNLLYIECYLENNIKWSDGEDITKEDIIATFNILKESDVNPIISSLLKDVTIEGKEGMIIFSNTNKDINIINLFFQPILPKKIIDNLSIEEIGSSLSPINGIYSGMYKIGSVDQNETIGITKIILEQNENYFKNDIYIDKIILKIFNDNSHFLKNKSSINIFNDKDNIIGDSIPRLKVFNYTLPQFVGVFLNEEKLKSKDLRSYILDNIDRNKIIENLGKGNVTEIINPFLTDIDINNDKNEITLSAILKNEGYFSKEEILSKNLNENKVKTYSNEVVVRAKLKQETLSFITSPITDKYNFIKEDDVLLKGKTNDSDVEFVYINDYKLKGFKKGDALFYYRLKVESYETIVEGKNTYKIYFEKDGKKKFAEELFVYYYKDTEKLENIKKELIEEDIEIDNEREGVDKSTETQVVTSSGEVSEFKNINIVDTEKLDSNFYYNNKLEPFSLNLLYIETDNNVKKSAELIKSELENYGIKIELFPINIGTLTESLRNEDLNYDIILIGVNMGYFDFNIFPYFHSSQVNGGYNFSNFKKLSLDILLEELKSNNLPKTKIIEVEKKILDVLRDEQIVKTLYSPNLKLLIDQNIENFELGSSIPDNIYRFEPLKNIYISKRKIIDFSTKGFFDFFKFIFNSII